MPQKFLYLFDRHSFVDSACCQRSAKFMRVNAFHGGALSEVSQPELDCSNAQSFCITPDCHKQGRAVIGPLCKIGLKMKLRSRVKVSNALLVALARDNAFSFREIDCIP